MIWVSRGIATVVAMLWFDISIHFSGFYHGVSMNCIDLLGFFHCYKFDESWAIKRDVWSAREGAPAWRFLLGPLKTHLVTVCIYIYIYGHRCLVGGWFTPLKKIRVRQLGWWDSLYIWENKIHGNQTTNQVYTVHVAWKKKYSSVALVWNLIRHRGMYACPNIEYHKSI